MTPRWPRTGGGREDREALVERYLPLARSLAARYRGSDEPFDDLFQVACLGLVNAVDRYDPARGAAFSSFAVPTILGELRRHFRDHTWAVRVPRDQQELYLRCERARDDLSATLGRQPTTAELAEELGATEEQVLHALELNLAYRPLALDGPDDEAAAEPAPGTVERGYELAEHRAVLALLFKKLTPHEAEIVVLRFHHDLTQDAIAERVGVSQMQISRVLHRSLARLRDCAA